MATIHTIWQNIDLNLDEWQDFLSEEYPEVVSESEKYRLIEERNDIYLEDERQNLDIDVESGMIICIASLGLWDGRKPGYRIIESGNIADCLQFFGCDHIHFYVDGRGQFRATGHHHDGTHHLLFREVKPGTSAKTLSTLCWKIMENDHDDRVLSQCTRKLGPYIQKVYGW